MSKETVTIKFAEMELEVSGWFTSMQFGNREQPDNPATFEINEIIWNKEVDEESGHSIAIDVTELIYNLYNCDSDKTLLEDIEEESLKQLEDE